jgi:hypothetical protein
MKEKCYLSFYGNAFYPYFKLLLKYVQYEMDFGLAPVFSCSIYTHQCPGIGA